MLEEIIEYTKGKSFKVSLTESSIPLKYMHAEFEVVKVSETDCEVSMCMDFAVKFGPLGALLGMIIMRPVMNSVQEKMLSGLAYYACTGSTVDSELPHGEVLSQVLAS